jgi:hypothetical protein
MRFSESVQLISAADLFVTPEIRNSPWAQEIFESVGKVYVTDAKLTDGHFSTYLGAIERRAYKPNPRRYRSHLHVQELYTLHECDHIRKWRRGRKELRESGERETFQDWVKRMSSSEREASLISECYAYVHIPGLRELTFTHPIWVDRFMEGVAVVQGINDQGTRGIERFIEARRLQALSSPSNDDYIEHQIERYDYQNIQWGRIWAKPLGGPGPDAETPAFRLVEAHMGRGDLPDLAEHRAWLDRMTHRHVGPDGTLYEEPFPRQAADFEPIYHETNEKFGNDVLTA